MNVEMLEDNNKTIETQYEELVKAAEKQYPNLIKDLETFTSYKVELQSYKAYLDAFNQNPIAISVNSTT